jgi:hypothetical protein
VLWKEDALLVCDENPPDLNDIKVEELAYVIFSPDVATPVEVFINKNIKVKNKIKKFRFLFISFIPLLI